jgi:GMP synthase (glutamine-hydrolysing)
MKTAVVFRHVGFEDLGSYHDVLLDRGYEIQFLEAGVSPLDTPQARDADLLVVLGGPIGAYEIDRYPFLVEERALIEHRLAARKLVLGVCLGAQLIALAAGARVYPGGVKEIGWAPVRLTPEGERSPLAAIGDAPVLHWHGDTFDLPYGAVLLASTGTYAHQAFAIGNHALALQFHIEAGAAIERWLIGHTLELALAGIDLNRLREETAAHYPRVKIAAAGVLTAWLEHLELAREGAAETSFGLRGTQ